jgi:hypothetical protein
VEDFTFYSTLTQEVIIERGHGIKYLSWENLHLHLETNYEINGRGLFSTCRKRIFCCSSRRRRRRHHIYSFP